MRNEREAELVGDEDYEDSADDELGDDDGVDAFSDDNLETEGKPGLSMLETTMSITTCVIGSGVMALPQLPTRAGWFLCAIFLVVSLYSVLESGIVLWKAFTVHNARSDEKNQMESYGDFAMEGGGKCASVLVRVLIVTINVGSNCGYIILMSTQISSITSGKISQKLVTLCGIPIFLALSMLQSVSAVAQLVPIALGCALLGIAMILLQSQSDRNYWMNWPVADQMKLHKAWPSSLLGMSGSLATLFGAFATMSNVPSILSEMKDKREFPQAWRLAMGGCGLLYMAVMWFGYQGYGEFILSNVVDNLMYTPANPTQALNCDWYYKDWTGMVSFMEAEITSVCVVINLLISMPLLQQAMFSAISSFCPVKLGKGTCGNYIMRIVVVALCVLVALVLPSFGDVFALVAALAAPALNAIFPLVLGFFIRRKSCKKSWMRYTLHAGILLLATLCSVLGLIDAIMGLVDTSPGCHMNPKTTPGCNGTCNPHLSEQMLNQANVSILST